MNKLGMKSLNSVKTMVIRAAIICVATLTAPQLTGQETWSTIKYGVQLSAFMGNKLDEEKDTPLGVTGFLEKIWNDGLAIRGRLELTTFGKDKIGAALDLVYYSRENQLYPFVGIGNMNMGNPINLTLGCGWNFNNYLGFEVKFWLGDLKSSVPLTQVSLLLRY